MNIGRIIRVITIPKTQPVVIPIKNWPRRWARRPIEVPNWPVKVPEKIETDK